MLVIIKDKSKLRASDFCNDEIPGYRTSLPTGKEYIKLNKIYEATVSGSGQKAA